MIFYIYYIYIYIYIFFFMSTNVKDELKYIIIQLL